MNLFGRILIASALGVLLSAMVAEPGFAQENTPPMSEILANVRSATLPGTTYTAEIQQSVTRTQDGKAKSSATDAGEETTTIVDLKPAGFSARPAPVSTDKAKATTSTTPQAQVQVVFNPVQTLQDMQTWQVAVTTEDYSGRPCYKIVGQSSGPLAATVFVDRERWCVYSVAVKMADRTVIDATAEYNQLPSGLWVPNRVVILHPTEGVQITQNFSEFKAVE